MALRDRLSALGLEPVAPLEAPALRRLEAAIGSALPPPLRAHLTKVSDGGPGPDGGLWPLESALARLRAPGDAARSFPIRWREVDRLIADKQSDDSVVHFDDERPLPLEGVIPIAGGGDGLLVAVVTRGKRAGQVWLVGEAWTPLLDDEGAPLSFADWWLRWLEATEAQAKAPDAKPAQAKPATAKPATAKPATAKPATAKPATAKPAKAKPAKAKPAAAKPAKAEAVTAKPARPTEPSTSTVATAGEASWPRTLRRAWTKPTEVATLALNFDREPCELDALPDVFGAFTTLAQLDISHSRKLRALPASLSRLTTVKKVWLTSLPNLESIGPIASLAKLETLNVSRCRALRALPEGMERLTELQELIAMFTGLRSLPEGLGSAPKLRKLWLQQSFELNMAGAWPVIQRMRSLTHLSLADGRWKSWPAGAITPPPALVEIDVTRAEVPDRIASVMRAWPGVRVRG